MYSERQADFDSNGNVISIRGTASREYLHDVTNIVRRNDQTVAQAWLCGSVRSIGGSHRALTVMTDGVRFRLRIIPSDRPVVGHATQCTERKPARLQLRHKPTHGFSCVTTIGTGVLVVAVVDDNDVSGRCFFREPLCRLLGVPRAPPVPVPHASR